MKIKYILIFIGVIVIFYLSTIHLDFILIGDNVDQISIGEQYIEKGADVCYRDIFNVCLFKSDIKIENNIDNTKIGNYEVKYTIDSTFFKKQIKRIIEVVDLECPVIEADKEIIKICPNEEVDINYSAYDNYDKDITSKVKKSIVENKLILEVFDSSNNYSSLEIPIEYVDNEKPTITLTDGAIYLLKGEKYKEPGYKAVDNCLGNITNKVKITNNIDINKSGTYTVTYTVSDDMGNVAKATRKVYVYENSPVVPSKDKVIYLTFDDGRSKYTFELLDILKKYDVKATFFVTSNGSDEAIKRIYEDGHSIGLHTYSHNYKEVYKSASAYFADLAKINNRVKKLTGLESKLIRFPGGSSNTVSNFNPGIMSYLSKQVLVKGYQYFDWNVSSGDTETSDTNKIVNNVIKSLKKGNNIVLQHDTNHASVKAVSKIIEYGKANGYTFKSLNVNSPTAHHVISN